jgi:hypothetical protein
MKKLFWLFAHCLLLIAVGHAATATPVTVTSITVAGQTVTVNATAHGIVVNRGFCLSTQLFCGTAATAAANSFTFTSASVVACASSCGTVRPAKQIIALQITPPPNQIASGVCWLATTSPVPATSASAWSGASQEEKNAIGVGTTMEVPIQPFPVAGATLASFKAYAQNACAGLQSALDTGIPPAFVLGNFFDGVGWLN